MSQQKKLTGAGFSPLQATGIVGDLDAAVTATGNNAATAYPIGFVNTNVTTTAASTGVILPTGGFGDELYVYNNGANALTVYPPVGGTVNGAASVSIAAGGWSIFRCASTTGLGYVSK
jgi:hypothetical protein